MNRFIPGLLLVSLCASVNAEQYFWITPKYNDLKDVLVANDVGGSVDGFYSYSFGKTLQRHSNWNVGEFSNLNSPTPLSDYQASIDPNWYGSTSIQKIGPQATIHLSSYSLPTPSLSGWYYTGWQHQINQKPWSQQFGEDPKACLEHSQTVVGSYNEGAVFYNGSAVWVMDKNGRELLFDIKVWDNRLPNSELLKDGVFYDIGLNTSYIGASYKENSKYLTLMPFSNSANSSTGNDLKWYGMCISKQHLLSAVNDMNTLISDPNLRLDTDISDYTVTSVILSSEIGNLPTATQAGGAGWYTSRFAGIYFYTDY